MRHDELGRYSFLMADPVDWFQPQDAAQTFAWLDNLSYPVQHLDELPPFQGGIAGLLSYDFNRYVETIKNCAVDPTLPPVAFGIYDAVIAWDHLQDRCWIVSQGYPELDISLRRARAKERANHFANLLLESKSQYAPSTRTTDATESKIPNLSSNFERDEYISTIQRAIQYIRSGDVFQVNIAQQLSCPITAESLDLFEQMGRTNPATFAAYFDLGEAQIISASPERLVACRDRQIESRPIKGTRRRTGFPEADLETADELASNAKDRSENVMIVDLMRNDLARICEPDSVIVSQFVKLESYASVIHLVSAVQGLLREEVANSDIVRAVFPGGSITGAPKIRAMEIIAELERGSRGAYCGSIGYFGFGGSIDLNILIRTVTAHDGKWTVPVGGGIVIDSDPVSEFEETLTKAHGMLRAIQQVAGSRENDLLVDQLGEAT